MNLIPIVIWAPVPIKEQKQIQIFMYGLFYKLSENCEIVIVSDNFIKCSNACIFVGIFYF